MDIIREPKGIQEFTGACELSGQHVVWREKKKSALTGVYKNRASIEGSDELAYRVANQICHRE